MKVIIVGAHGEAKELINRISSGWSISVIDLDQDKLRNFSTNRQIEKIQGDATSSLVLKKAGLDSTTAVITLTLKCFAICGIVSLYFSLANIQPFVLGFSSS